jgi:hypothetical protein
MKVPEEDRFLLHLSQFIVHDHHTIRRYITQVAQKASVNKLRSKNSITHLLTRHHKHDMVM